MSNILNRKLLLIFLGFTAGVFLYQYSPFLTLLLLPFALISLKFTGRKGIVLILSVAMFFAAGNYTALRDSESYEKSAPVCDVDAEISGTVISIPEPESYGQSAVVKTKYGKIRLMTNEPVLRYKDNLTFRAKCYRPEEKIRPLSFDYPLYLKSEGIYLLAFSDDITIHSSSVSYLNPYDAITVLRASLIDKANSLWTGESLMFARSLLLGDTSYSSAEFKDKLSSGSISHIIAVSGTHVSFVAALFLSLCAFCSKRKRYINLLVFPFIIAFVILTGASASAIRAAIMLIVYLIAKSILSHYDGFTALSFAAFLILLVNPMSAFSLSFILSFSAVLGILLFAKPFTCAISFLRLNLISQIFGVTLSAQVFTGITLCFAFGKIPFTALIANILAVPLIPFVMASGYLSLALSFIVPGESIFSLLTEVLMGICIAIADLSGKLPFANIYPAFSNIYVILFIFALFIGILVAVFIFRAKKTALVLTPILIASIVFNAYIPALYGGSSFYFADSDHSDCTFIFNKNHAVMIDCPPSGDFVKNTAIPILKHHGITELDALVITEEDFNEDSVFSLTDAFSVKHLYIPDGADITVLQNNDAEINFLKEGGTVSVGDIKISVLLISKGVCSISVTNGDAKLLLPGNIEAKAEALLSEKVSDVDMLKAPRHGNKASCSETLLDAAKPEAVIVSTGRRLSDDFSERLKNYSVYSTKTGGDITVNCKTKEINPYKKVK